MNLNSVEIKEFWGWFARSITAGDNIFNDDDFINSLDRKITGLGDVTWEIGPGINNPDNNSFVISPCGNKELLTLTSRIIEMALNLIGWEFYRAKPPKAQQMCFTLEDECGNDIKIDASDWRYGLLKYEADYDIIIQATSIENLMKDLQYTAVEILLDGEISEEARIIYLNRIEIVDNIDSRLNARHNSIKNLRNHFARLISEMS